MGGAIAVHVAVKNLLPSIVGLAVIDVVEGTVSNNAINTLVYCHNQLDRNERNFNEATLSDYCTLYLQNWRKNYPFLLR